jgi:hypothetical protein
LGNAIIWVFIGCIFISINFFVVIDIAYIILFLKLGLLKHYFYAAKSPSFFVALGLELRAYTFSHSTSPFSDFLFFLSSGLANYFPRLASILLISAS